MSKVLSEKDGRIGRITLNHPDVLNAIDDDLPRELAAAVAEADADSDVHVMVLSGAGKAFCAGYDQAHYAEGASATVAPLTGRRTSPSIRRGRAALVLALSSP